MSRSSDDHRSTWSRVWRWARFPVLLLVGLLAARIIIGIVGAIDWGAVWSAVRLLTIVQGLILLLVLLVRQVWNAIPLSRFVAGLGLGHSMQNDLGAGLIGTVAPPPADVVLRVSMYRSWGIDPIEGMAGVTMNTLTFYSVRFLTPALGLILLAIYEGSSQHKLAAAASTLISVVILVAVVAISRGDRLAARLGRDAGRVAARFRDSVDAESWSATVVDFRARVGERARTGIAPSLAALVAMVLSDATIALLALRFVGVDASLLPLVVVYGAFLLVYPLTLFPLMGLGILDAALVALWTEVAGIDAESRIVAGLVVWRVMSLLMPLVIGVPSLLWWRRTADVRGGTGAPTTAVSDRPTEVSD